MSVHVRMHDLFIYAGFKRGDLIPSGTTTHYIELIFSGISAISGTSGHVEMAGNPLFSEFNFLRAFMSGLCSIGHP